MSKVGADTIIEAISAILDRATSKDHKKKFIETIELQIALKNFDPVKDKRFSGVLRLPVAPRKKFTVCIIGDAKHIEDAKAANIPFASQDDLKKLKKDKKLVKKFANQYDAFLASASLIRLIPRIVGPGLNKAGKFPSLLNPNDNILEKVEAQKQSIKFQLKSKRGMCLGVPVGNIEQSKEQLVANINLSINYLASLLPKNWQQIKRLYLKSTMGPSHRIFGF